MLAFGCILIGIGAGLILGNVQETVALSLIGLTVGSFLYTKLGIYIKLNVNKKAKSMTYVIIGILIGIIVGFITGEFLGSVIMGIGCAITALNITNYRKFKKINGNKIGKFD